MTTAKSLHALLRANAPEHERRDHADQTSLLILWREIDAHFKAHPKAGDWGYEGWTRTYAWTQVAGSRFHVTLTDAMKLGDIRYRWIAVFYVTGGSEGHYVHAELVLDHGADRQLIPFLLTKTFAGDDAAREMAGELSRILGV